MDLIVLLFVPPILQIIFSILHISNKIKTPLGVIAFLTLFFGFMFSVSIMTIEQQQLLASFKNRKCLDCGLVGFSILFVGTFINIITSPTILAIFILIKKYKTKIDTKGNNLS